MTVFAFNVKMLEESPPDNLRRVWSYSSLTRCCIFASSFAPSVRRPWATFRRTRRVSLLTARSIRITARQTGTKIARISRNDRIANAHSEEIAITWAAQSGIAGFRYWTHPLTRCNASINPIAFEDSFGIDLLQQSVDSSVLLKTRASLADDERSPDLPHHRLRR